MATDIVDRNDIAYWYPRLERAGLPTPQTVIVQTDVNLPLLLDGVKPDGFDDFIELLQQAARTADIPYPLFLRTGHTSGKHAWKRTCHVEREQDLASHVNALVEHSEIVSIIGLPVNTWAVRRFVPLNTVFLAFEGMPVSTERRWFAKDGKVICDHRYWPTDSIQNASALDFGYLLEADASLQIGESHRNRQRALAERASSVLGGAWSIDMAMTREGEWLVIDCAEMDRSYHDPACLNA